MKVPSTTSRRKKKERAEAPSTPDLRQLYANLAENIAVILEHPSTPERIHEALAEAAYEIISETEAEKSVPQHIRQYVPRAGEILAAREKGGEQ